MSDLRQRAFSIQAPKLTRLAMSAATVGGSDGAKQTGAARRWRICRDLSAPRPRVLEAGSRLLMRALAQRAFHQRLQLAAGVQLANDVASADELAVDENLRDGRPVAVGFDRVAHFLVGEHVDRGIGRAQFLEHFDRCGRKAALGKVTVAFHENDDLVAVDRGTNPLDWIGHLNYLTSGSDTGSGSSL